MTTILEAWFSRATFALSLIPSTKRIAATQRPILMGSHRDPLCCLSTHPAMYIIEHEQNMSRISQRIPFR